MNVADARATLGARHVVLRAPPRARVSVPGAHGGLSCDVTQVLSNTGPRQVTKDPQQVLNEVRVHWWRRDGIGLGC